MKPYNRGNLTKWQLMQQHILTKQVDDRRPICASPQCQTNVYRGLQVAPQTCNTADSCHSDIKGCKKSSVIVFNNTSSHCFTDLLGASFWHEILRQGEILCGLHYIKYNDEEDQELNMYSNQQYSLLYKRNKRHVKWFTLALAILTTSESWDRSLQKCLLVKQMPFFVIILSIMGFS